MLVTMAFDIVYKVPFTLYFIRRIKSSTAASCRNHQSNLTDLPQENRLQGIGVDPMENGGGGSGPTPNNQIGLGH